MIYHNIIIETKIFNVVLSFLIIILLFIVPSSSHGHSGGGSVAQIDGEKTKKYTDAEYSQIGDEIIPEDIAPGKYIVKNTILFEVDTQNLPVSEDTLKNTTYTWDFGDGKKSSGESVEHVFTKAKSYIVNLEIKYAKPSKESYPSGSEMGTNPLPETQSQSILIHVLPDKNYKIPTAKIVIDGKEIKDPIKDRPKFKFYNNFLFFKWAKTFTFDASKSSGSEKITSYKWDFGEDQTLEKAMVRYKFKEKSFFYSVGLKITDRNGFYTYLVLDMADENAF